jgi:hypothetical protein
MGCSCRGTPGVGASQRRLGCRWWGGRIRLWAGLGQCRVGKGEYGVTQRGGLHSSVMYTHWSCRILAQYGDCQQWP